jgi:AcrR family transcriptional regulator
MTLQAPEIRRPVGRPRGRTLAGLAARENLYEVALSLMAERGYEQTTLRDIARRAGVSPGLLYRYFPSKRAVVLDLYERLSTDYAARAVVLPPGGWTDRFLFALETSLEVLGPHREALASLLPVLVGDRDEGVLAPASAACRRSVEAVFEEAVAGARNAPGSSAEAAALGRMLYLAHLACLLFWLLDRSPAQRATQAVLATVRRGLPLLALALRFGRVRSLVRQFDAEAQAGLFAEER